MVSSYICSLVRVLRKSDDFMCRLYEKQISKLIMLKVKHCKYVQTEICPLVIAYEHYCYLKITRVVLWQFLDAFVFVNSILSMAVEFMYTSPVPKCYK